jgi:hypothetical protein
MAYRGAKVESSNLLHKTPTTGQTSLSQSNWGYASFHLLLHQWVISQLKGTHTLFYLLTHKHVQVACMFTISRNAPSF